MENGRDEHLPVPVNGGDLEGRRVSPPRQIERDGLRFFVAWFISRLMLAPLLWFLTRVMNRTEFIGLENLDEVRGGSFLVCPNHTSAWDILSGWEVGYACIKSHMSWRTYLCGFGALERLGPRPFLDIAMLAGVLPVDRTQGIEQYPLQDLVRIVREGRVKVGALIYPEGTRSLTGRLAQKAKAGAGWIVAQTGLPVIPVYQMGYRRLPGIGRRLRIVIGKPMYFDDAVHAPEAPATWISVTQRIMDAIRALETTYNPAGAAEQDGSAPILMSRDPARWTPALRNMSRPVVLLRDDEGVGLAAGAAGAPPATWGGREVALHLPSRTVENLGAPSFREDHGTACACVAVPAEAGVARGELVAALTRAGVLACLGLDYRTMAETDRLISDAKDRLEGRPLAASLTYLPFNRTLEDERVDLLLRRGVRCLVLANYVQATAALVRFRAAGATRAEDGTPRAVNHLMVRVGHAAVARHFAAPPPADVLAALVAAGRLSTGEADAAAALPLVDDVVVDPDAGGRPGIPVSFLGLFPAIRSAVREVAPAGGSPRVGVAGELGTPEAVRSAFAMGADFILLGSLVELAVEAEGSARRREMLSRVEPGDALPLPLAEVLGSDVRVPAARFGSMVGARAGRLLALSVRNPSLAELDADDLRFVGETCFGVPADTALAHARLFADLWWPELAAADRPMELLTRYYLHSSQRWAVEGAPGRELDYQVRCGGGLGPFNAWRLGSDLALPASLTAQQIVRNLFVGALALGRAAALRENGFPVHEGAFTVRPRVIPDIEWQPPAPSSPPGSPVVSVA